MMRQQRLDQSINFYLATVLVGLALVGPWPVHAQSSSLSLDTSLTPGSTETAAASQPAPAVEDTGYRVDSGDRVSITVYQEDDLNIKDVRVRDNGTISFPLLGELQVRGLTSNQIGNLVTRRLFDGYLKNPNVTVSIDAYRLYYIKGEVSRPGGYSYMDGLTVEKAVALAGGYTVRAAENDIKVVRETDPDNPMDVNRPSTPVLPGDVITVGESFF